MSDRTLLLLTTIAHDAVHPKITIYIILHYLESCRLFEYIVAIVVMQDLSWLAEYAAFAIMLGLSVAVGLYYGCVQDGKQNTVDEYLLGSKHMSVFPITMSLIARYDDVYALRSYSSSNCIYMLYSLNLCTYLNDLKMP